jgi:hypothetical protein
MRRKVSTIIDESLFRRTKLEAARQGRPLADVLEDALGAYLAGGQRVRAGGSSVEATWGALAADPDLVREIMDADDDSLES